jgi:hypothetical protein
MTALPYFEANQKQKEGRLAPFGQELGENYAMVS